MRIALPPTLSPEAFAGHDPKAALVDLAGETMGTTWSVRYAAPPRSVPAAMRAAIIARLAGLVRDMSHWDADSLLSRFNRSAAGTWVRLPPDFAHVMARGLGIARETDGAFDPAIGALVNLWGFGPSSPCRRPSESLGLMARAHAVSARDPSFRWDDREGRPQRGETAIPDDDALAAARAASGHRQLVYHPENRLLRQPGGLSLDLSGIAKGHAVDAVAGLLARHGIAHCLVEIGGELVGRGIRPDGDPWWVDLESPPGLSLPPLRIALHGLAVATSGDYRRGAHTLDPRTGYPIGSSVVSCSVIHRTALDADAWATALTVLGPDGMKLADAAGIAARIVTVVAGDLQEYLTAGLRAMLAD